MKNKYYEFKSEFEVQKWIDENYDSFIKEIQQNYNNENTLGHSLFTYTGSMSKPYNNFLRLNQGNIENINKIIDNYYKCDKGEKTEAKIYEIFCKDAKRDILNIYRAFSLNKIKGDILLFHYFNINDFNKQNFVKEIFQINNFISTTLLRKSEGINKLIKQNKYNSLLIIKTKSETPCIPIWNNPNSTLKEHEIILAPKTKFKIYKKRIKLFSKIKYLFECEIDNSK